MQLHRCTCASGAQVPPSSICDKPKRRATRARQMVMLWRKPLMAAWYIWFAALVSR
uniref:Uncharacterized protein n=1 Tax=Mola mola TaxID=94237 RepID=A0A3Q4AY02_MOLML